jgi:hypothetical protein
VDGPRQEIHAILFKLLEAQGGSEQAVEDSVAIMRQVAGWAYGGFKETAQGVGAYGFEQDGDGGGRQRFEHRVSGRAIHGKDIGPNARWHLRQGHAWFAIPYVEIRNGGSLAGCRSEDLAAHWQFGHHFAAEPCEVVIARDE